MKNFISMILLIGVLSSCGVKKKYEEALSSESILLYEEYISKYPKSKYLNQAKAELNILYEERDWKYANRLNSIAAYQRFLIDFPNSKYANEAEIRIKARQEYDDWLKSFKINTVYAYENFLTAYPESIYAFDARNKIEQMKEKIAWEEAESQSTVASYKNYISAYPRSAKKGIALDRIKEIQILEPAWSRAVKANTPDGYRTFINKYASSKYGSKAKENLNQLDMDYWQYAKTKKSITEYENYLDHFPDGEYKVEAEKAIIDIEVDNIIKGEHGLLPPMSKSTARNVYTNTNDIEIFNNTNYILTVRYSGSIMSKKIVIKPKQKLTFFLKNGKYRVAASVDDKSISNYAGEEKLIGGSYSSEFYIVTQTYWDR